MKELALLVALEIRSAIVPLSFEINSNGKKLISNCGNYENKQTKLVELSKRTKRVVYANIAISVLVTFLLVLTVLSGFELNLAAGIALHEASAIIIIINGMWVSGSDSARFSTLIELFRDLILDLRIIFNILFGLEKLDKTTTS